MCGICGILDSRGPADMPQALSRMCQLAAHRGPDDEGLALFGAGGALWRSGDGNPAGCPGGWMVGLGHRRLSIIDLSPAGHQPMADASGRYWLVFNGEVYNYIELRRELEQVGKVFRSHTDSEVILQAYIAWGPACLRRFNGMWALAIYDRETGKIFCARDRYGVKPFHYACEAGRFAFASEIKQLLALPWLKAAANHARIADFFLWSLKTHTDETPFLGIRSLPESHYLEMTPDDLAAGRCEAKSYWSPSPGEAMEERDAVAAFRDLLSDSVRLRLRSDVPVGVTLSGGLDSSSIVCLAGEHRRANQDGSPFDAFNVDFELPGYSERQFAEAAAGKAGARMVVLRPGQADLARDWEKFVWHMEEPFEALSDFSNFQIYRLIREHGIPVVLCGQGGDEVLLGYDRYRTYDALFKLRSGHPWAALGGMMSTRRHASISLATQAAAGLYYSMPVLRAFRRRRLVQPFLNPGFFREFSGRTEHLLASTRHRNRQDLQMNELFHYQLPEQLRPEDRVSMAHSVETRLPFLDYRLLDLVLGQPMDMLIRGGWSKYILRQAMQGILPEEVRCRTAKMGYDTPTASLIRQNRKLFLPLLARHREDPVLDVPAIERSFDSPALDERLLCSAMSYLGWREAFSVAD